MWFKFFGHKVQVWFILRKSSAVENFFFKVLISLTNVQQGIQPSPPIPQRYLCPWSSEMLVQRKYAVALSLFSSQLVNDSRQSYPGRCRRGAVGGTKHVIAKSIQIYTNNLRMYYFLWTNGPSKNKRSRVSCFAYLATSVGNL